MKSRRRGKRGDARILPCGLKRGVVAPRRFVMVDRTPTIREENVAKRRCSWLVIIGLLLPTALAATIIHVPADESTIQAGIDAAVDGDTVLIADGLYTGPGNRDIDFEGKTILVTSENGAEATIIDCGGTSVEAHRAFHFHKGERPQTLVRGLTIRGGYFAWEYGGGILCEHASPTIADCIFEGNVAYHGGAVYCADSSAARILNSLFVDNTALGT